MREDTIVAIATPPGRGGVGIIRISGTLACSIAQSLTGKCPAPRSFIHCSFFDKKRTLIDQGLILYFKAPHSFTGEDVIEMQVHGSPFVLDWLLQEAITLGARLARPGEFSERAFLNDKLDLVQAEAIADLIQASTETAARMAVRSLQGDFSQKINEFSDQLIQLRTYVEAAIDFPEEEIDFLKDGHVEKCLQELLETLQSIRMQAHTGAILREGISVVMAGRPNAGKSTLMNALAGREVAIVTPIAGTTRDIMREHIVLDDIPVQFLDTAGLHDSEDIIEKEGILRAWQEISRADCILLVVDVNEAQTMFSLEEEIRAVLPHDIPMIQVWNKADTLNPIPVANKSKTTYISAKTGHGLTELKAIIKEAIGYQPTEAQFLARRRHLQAIEDAQKALISGLKQLQVYRAGELLAEELQIAHRALGEITGKFSADDLLGSIFSSFCIGK